MVLTRPQFFLVLSIVFLGPFYAPRLIWLARSRTATGKVWFIGHTLELQGDVSSHLVILFKLGRGSFYFNGRGHFKVGDPVPVRYNKTRPADAKINTAFSIWADVLVNSLFPGLVLLILFITPRRFDPLIPWNARVRIGIKPLIKIIPNGSDAKIYS
jgi:hypothetical protein